MFQNIKVDIIYHKINTDFEMEFNLCGCCRMRLLTTKSPDKKTLVHSLARAVSRSRVIIIVGELFGQNNIVDTIAAAIGSKTEIADNQKYGIDSNIDIKIISQSIPLVTPEGYFGGCIIEKGPQTMVLLSDNKNVRKSVMRSLIHPYIEELCALDLKEKAESAIENQDKNDIVKAKLSTEAFFEIEETTNEKPLNVEAEESVEEQEVVEEVVETTMETEGSIQEVEEETIEEAEELDLTDDSGFIFQDEAEDIADERTVDDDDIEGLVIESEEEILEENIEGVDDSDIEGLIIDSEASEEDYYDDEEELDLITEDDYEEIQMENVNSSMLTEDETYEVEFDILYEETTIDLKTFNKRNADYYNNDYETMEDLLTEEDELYNKKAMLKGGSNVSLWIVSFIVLALLLVVCYSVFIVPASDGISPVAYLKDIYNTLFE